MTNNVKTITKKFVPANVDVLKEKAQAPNFEVEYDEHSGKPIAYHTPFKPIKVLLKNPWYDKLKMNGLTLEEAFNALKKVFTTGDKVQKERMYDKFQANIKAYNQELVDKLLPHLLVNQADKKLDGAIYYGKQHYNTRWMELHLDTDMKLNSYKYYDNLSEEDRAIRLARAADYGIYPVDYVGYASTKEIYTFRKGELKEEAEQPNEPSDALLEAVDCLHICWTELDLKIQQHASGASIARTLDKIIFIKKKMLDIGIGDSLHWLRPMDTYYKVGENGYEGTELVTLAGRFTYRDLFKRKAENEALAMAEILAKEYGDEFLERVKIMKYQIVVYIGGQLIELYTGSYEQCAKVRKTFEQLYEDCFLRPTQVEVTKRDIRLGDEEDEPLEWHDFQYETHAETDDRFNEDEFDEAAFLGYDRDYQTDDESEDEYALCRESDEEDEIDYMYGECEEDE